MVYLLYRYCILYRAGCKLLYAIIVGDTGYRDTVFFRIPVSDTEYRDRRYTIYGVLYRYTALCVRTERECSVSVLLSLYTYTVYRDLLLRRRTTLFHFCTRKTESAKKGRSFGRFYYAGTARTFILLLIIVCIFNE
jgi:hypothetical protein